MTVNRQRFINHAGGEKGAEETWALLGYNYGVETIAYTFQGAHTTAISTPFVLSVGDLREGWYACIRASQSLGVSLDRLSSSHTKRMLSRRWFQAVNADMIVVIGSFRGRSTKIISGNSGWTCQMAIDIGKPVWLFEQGKSQWFRYDYDEHKFLTTTMPLLTPNFCGIGTMYMEESGIGAIDRVYRATFDVYADKR